MDNQNDVALKPLAFSGIYLMAILLVVFVAIAFYIKWDGRNFRMLEAQVGSGQSDMPKDLQAFPNPKLQMRPQWDYQAYKKHQLEIVDKYGWVDKSRGVIRIPIEKAIDILAQKNLPYEEHKGE